MNNEWTEETIMPYLFKMVEVSDDTENWTQRKLVGFSKECVSPFISKFDDSFRIPYKYMRPLKEKKTVVEPWTFETCPWPLHFKFVNNGICNTAIRKEHDGVIYLDYLYKPRLITYIDLCDMYGITCLDGSPCGIVREVDV
jgi:hypothetical protein